ncbi:hypothetical protein PMAYCL1PPCAC_13888, partial [Pristionchus mayeri]
RFPFLLLSIVPLVLSGRTAKDCTIGEQWTDRFIRFECYQGTGAVVKGVRAIGCVPTNTESGAMIQPGATFDEKYFTYSCSKDGNSVTYQIINCRDETGSALAVGEARNQSDGSVWKCYKDDSGAVKLAQDKEGGCLFNGKTYAAGQVWSQDQEFKANVDGVEQLIGKAIGMECRKDAVQGFVAQPFRCITTTGASLSSGSFGKVNSLNVKCSIAANGAVTMSVVNEEDVTCSADGVTVQNGQMYTTPDGVNVYKCVYGILTKKSCIINGRTIAMGSLASIDGKSYHCNSGAGMVDFRDIWGCTLSDGNIKAFFTTWINGTEVQRCNYRIRSDTVQPYTEFWGCSFGNKAIGKNKIVASGKELKKCAVVGRQYGMRDLTPAEYTAYLKSQSVAGFKNVIGGAGGSGAGGDVTAETEEETTPLATTTTTAMSSAPTTTRTTPTATSTVSTTASTSTTTARLTNTASTATSTVSSTTVPTTTTTTTTTTTAISSTSTASESSTAAFTTPSTSTTTIATSTTTLAVPITTSIASTTALPIVSETSTAQVPSTSSTPPTTEVTTTSAPAQGTSTMPSSTPPTTVFQDQCHDFFEMCSDLAPICQSPRTVAVGKIKEMMKNISDVQINELLGVLGDDKLRTSSEEEKDELNEVIRDLAGFEEEDEEDCGCRNDECASRCHKRKMKSCKKCQIFKRKIRELIEMVCPATCAACGTVNKIPAIIKALVRFYTKDCR